MKQRYPKGCLVFLRVFKDRPRNKLAGGHEGHWPRYSNKTAWSRHERNMCTLTGTMNKKLQWRPLTKRPFVPQDNRLQTRQRWKKWYVPGFFLSFFSSLGGVYGHKWKKVIRTWVFFFLFFQVLRASMATRLRKNIWTVPLSSILKGLYTIFLRSNTAI